MSIKIYQAYKVQVSQLQEATQFIQSHYQTSIQKRVNDILDGILKSENLSKVDTVCKFEEMQTKAQRKNFFDYYRYWDACFDFLIDGDSAYIIPYPPIDVIPPTFMQDYHYQDQVDRDSGIPDADWEERGRTWDKIYLSNPNPLMYRFNVLNMANGSFIELAPYTRNWFNNSDQNN